MTGPSDYLQAFVSSYRVVLDFASAQAAESEAAAAEHHQRGVDGLRRLLATGAPDDAYPWGSPPLVLRDGELRLLARRLLRGLSEREQVFLTTDCLDPESKALLASTRGRWFRAPGCQRVDLDTQPQLAGLLAALVEQRRRRPAQRLSPDELIERIWPAERILPDAASTRLYRVVSRLRKAGLGDWLVHEQAGYGLDTTVALICSRD